MSPESNAFEYVANVSFNMCLRGQPSDSMEYGGVTIDRNILPLWERVKGLQPMGFSKRIENMTPAEIHGKVEECLQTLLQDSVGVRLTGTFHDSFNPLGIPPWLRTTKGGSVLLELHKEVGDDGTKEWTSLWETKAGVSVSYYAEVLFEEA